MFTTKITTPKLLTASGN